MSKQPSSKGAFKGELKWSVTFPLKAPLEEGCLDGLAIGWQSCQAVAGHVFPLAYWHHWLQCVLQCFDQCRSVATHRAS